MFENLSQLYRQGKYTHQAFGLFGERKQILPKLLNFLKKDLNININGNPDFWLGEYNILKINEVRELNSKHLNQAVSGHKFFILTVNFITIDAQNALLKIFEEPQGQTTFFLIGPETLFLLPTLKSRLISWFERDNKNQIDTMAADFINKSLSNRLKITTDLVKNLKEEKITKKEIIDFLKKIEICLYLQKKDKNFLAIEDLEKAIVYAGDESPSLKIILDYLAITI